MFVCVCACRVGVCVQIHLRAFHGLDEQATNAVDEPARDLATRADEAPVAVKSLKPTRLFTCCRSRIGFGLHLASIGIGRRPSLGNVCPALDDVVRDQVECIVCAHQAAAAGDATNHLGHQLLDPEGNNL